MIDWASLTLPQHAAVFAALGRVHEDVISRVKVGTDNTVVFQIAMNLTRVMQAGNHDLVRREHRLARVACDCGVRP